MAAAHKTSANVPRNIGGDAHDKSYRYKMPQLNTKVQGRGNGIKTMLLNMGEVARALRVHPSYPVKHFGFELGAQARLEPGTGHGIVNGVHTGDALQRALDNFIATFVLCGHCRLPELSHDIRSSRVKFTCAACGHTGRFKSSGSKLLAYICKHPQSSAKSVCASARDNATDEALAASIGENKIAGPCASGSDWCSDTSKSAQLARMATEVSAATNCPDDATVRSRLEVAHILRRAAEENKVESPVTILRVFLASPVPRTTRDVRAELRRLAISRGWDAVEQCRALLAAVLTLSTTSDVETVALQIVQNAPYLRAAPSPLTLLQCFEEFACRAGHEAMLSKFANILQSLYAEDIVDEESLLQWSLVDGSGASLVSAPCAASSRARARPFIVWLQTAESEED